MSIEREMLAALRKRLGVGEPKAAAPVKGEQVTLAVFDFEPGGPVADLDQHSADLADLLTNYLSDAGATLVERKQLEAILREQRLIQAQRNGADQARLGKLLGAQRFLYTTMVQWAKEVRFDSQLVEPQSGLIVACVSAQGSLIALWRRRFITSSAFCMRRTSSALRRTSRLRWRGRMVCA